MKKFSTLFLIFLCLFCSTIKTAPLASTNTYKEGVYRIKTLDLTKTNSYSIQNVSSKDSVLVMIFDERQVPVQTLRLGSNSEKYKLLPLETTYRLVIIGDGEVFIS